MSDEDCIEMLRQLVREERDQGRITETEKQELLVYIFKTTPLPQPEFKYCEDCGCKLAYNLGDLEYHTGGCSNIPF